MDFCPKCGSLLLPRNNVLKCSCGYYKNLNGFHCDKLIIGMPPKFISSIVKNNLKHNYPELLKLIINKDEVEFTKDDLMSCFDQIIKKANSNFIDVEKRSILRNFKSLLNSQVNYIDDSLKETFRNKFKMDYFDYYHELGMEDKINKFNEEFIKTERNTFLNEINEYLESHNYYIDDSVKSCFENRFKKDYFDYYTVLNVNSLIDEHNAEIIEKEKYKFKNQLDYKYISNSEKLKLIESSSMPFDITNIIDEHNKNYIEAESRANKDFFANINGVALNPDQICAVLTDDDNTQIVAGAGTGKTFTLQAKVKYLIEKQGVSPKDILCLSYSRSATNDLAKKLKKTLGHSKVDVRTFHSMGYEILGIKEEGREVPEDELKMICDTYFKNILVKDSNWVSKVIDFFCFYYNLIYADSTNFNFQTIRSKLNQLDKYEELLKEYLEVSHVSDQKEYMKNFNELILANYLFINNIDYDYSKKLIFKTEYYDYLDNYIEYIFGKDDETLPMTLKKEIITNFDEDFKFFECEYYPNFFLPEYDIYISLSSKGINWQEILSKEDKESWSDKLKVIDTLNNEYNTKLLTIYDYDDDIDAYLNAIKNSLIDNGVVFKQIDYSKLYNLLIIEDKLPEYKTFLGTVEQFINLFRGNALYLDYEGNDISKLRFKDYFIENNKKYFNSIKKRNEFFLQFIQKIYEIYTKNLEDETRVDFNNMINDAVIALRKGANFHDYKYIIVDEYQDTSHTRYKLLKEMQNRTGAKIVVVGDDWQSIYGFTGCDIGLFYNFEKYFENPKRVKILLTHRNSQQLIEVAGDFIKRNKKQIEKKLRSLDTLTDNPIKLVGCMSRAEKVLSLMQILNELAQKNSKHEILILGRNNKDINEILCKKIFTPYEKTDYIKIVYELNKELNIKFRTIHKAKGLEADYVIVLNLTDKLNGFPNQMKNDPILDFVKIDNAECKYAEERRLFYVALTRTKNDVFLFHNEKRPSIFLKDIKKNYETLNFEFSNDEVMAINQLIGGKSEVIPTDNICPKCHVGNVNLVINNEDGKSYFRCSNYCGWNGGPYHNNKYNYSERSIKLTDVKYAKVCDLCGGMLVVKSQIKHPEIKFLGCNFYKRDGTGCNRRPENLPYSYYEITEDIYDLDITYHGVYYLYDYIPKREWEGYYNKKVIDKSKVLLDYKDGKEEYAINLITDNLMRSIILLHNKKLDDNINRIALVAAPASKKSRKNKSTIRRSIDIIERWSERGITESEFDFNKEIINCKDILKRVIDVPTAHLDEGRASFDQHVDSIECENIDISMKDLTFIVLDDITTTGDTMKACKQVLINNGVKEDNIYLLAIGGTI